MSGLTTLEGLPRPKKTGPHRWRVVGGRVLLTNDAGRFLFLDEADFRAFIAGRLGPEHPLWPDLAEAGFAGEADPGALALEAIEGSLLAWRGPYRHVLALDGMPLSVIRVAIDFAFMTPTPRLRLELTCAEPEKAWAGIWFAVEYAERKADWAQRNCSVTLRSRCGPNPEALEFLKARGVRLRAELTADGPAPRGLLSGWPASRALLTVGPRASAPEAWVDALVGAGVESVRLQPASVARPGRFEAFYATALDRMLATGEALREEWASEALGRKRWRLSGLDVLNELCFAADGSVFAGETAAAGGNEHPLRLGRLGETRYHDLAKSAAVRAAIAAALPDNQPLCCHCAYQPFCSLSPSLNLALQGTVWGRTASSPACALQLRLLDLVFGRMKYQKVMDLFVKWCIDTP